LLHAIETSSPEKRQHAIQLANPHQPGRKIGQPELLLRLLLCAARESISAHGSRFVALSLMSKPHTCQG
jgi:hypothetical protein